MAAWALKTPGEVHVTFDGHHTTCDLTVFENKPVYESKAKDVTCRTCGAYLTFDMEPALKAAVDYVRAAPGTAKWETAAAYEFGTQVAELAAGVAWLVKRDHGSWNSNHAFSEFMAGGGWMTDQSPEAKLIGQTALAVYEVLKEREAE
jgi:hypothetical protein